MRDNIFDIDKYILEDEFSPEKFIWLNYKTGAISNSFYEQMVTEDDLNSLGGILIQKSYSSKGVLNNMFIYLDRGFIKFSYYDYKMFKGEKQNFYRISTTYPEDYPESKVAQYKDTLQLTPSKNDYGVAILAQDSNGFRLLYQDSTKNMEDISMNYPTGFRPNIKKIVDNLNEESKGLYLFSGIPGTGKTSFVNYLANTVNKQFIYIPNTMVNSLDNPSFINFLSEHGNSVLIIEDAEECLKSRGSGNTGMVSTILNITDGLLGDILKIAVIATYNADDKIIDSALLRKGRLKHKHYFDKLPVEDAQALANKLGLKITINNPISLGDIYNYEEESFTNAPSKMGFV
jgi:hypothetical protein